MVSAEQQPLFFASGGAVALLNIAGVTRKTESVKRKTDQSKLAYEMEERRVETIGVAEQ